MSVDEVVVDASALAALALSEEGSRDAIEALREARIVVATSGTLLEVTDVLRSQRRRLGARLLTRVEPILALGLVEVSSSEVAMNALLLAIKHRVDVRLAAPVALAQLRGATLLTLDDAQRRLAEKEGQLVWRQR